MKTMDDILRQIENFELDRTFVTDAGTGTEYTYRAIYQKAGRVGTWLQAEGISELVVCMESTARHFIWTEISSRRF